MKKLVLLLCACALFFVPHKAHAQSIEACKQNACFGFGPPTGPANTNGYVYQDLSQTPPALYCPKNGVWVACGGSFTGALPNGSTATTQANGDNSTLVATDAFVLANAGATTCPIQNATNICLTQSPYNASIAGATTTTLSGTFGVGTSGPITSCSTFNVGNGVLITGAGAAGANYIGTVVSCTGGTLTVTPSTSTSKTTGTVVQHDETAALNGAIAALSTGGTIQLPSTTTAPAIYLVNGPLLDTSCANAVLPMLKLPNYVGNPIFLTIRGLDAPGGTSSQAGEIIQTSTPSGNFFGGCDSVTGGGFPPFTNAKLSLENLTLSSYTNPGVVMVNATALQGFIGRHLYVNMPSPSLPSNTAGGAIFLPAVGNNVQIFLDDVNSAGYYTLYKIGEHAHLGSVYGSFGVNCFQFDNGTTSAGTFVGNSASVDYMWDAHCTNAITGPSTNPMTVHVAVADLETAATSEVSDSSNLLHGIVNFTIPQASGVAINCSPRVIGGANLKLNPLQCQTAAGFPSLGLIEKWNGRDGSGSTLANTGSDSTNSATATNVTWASATGFPGTIATYNGTNSKATAASFTNTNFDGSLPFSTCTWTNPGTYPAVTVETLLSNVNATTGIFINLTGTSLVPGKINVFLYSTLSNFINVASTAAVVTAGSAHHICIVYAGTKVASGLTFYVDGVTVSTTTVTDSLTGGSIASATPFSIGNSGGGTTPYLGAIGPTLIYNRALTSADITSIYALGSGGF